MSEAKAAPRREDMPDGSVRIWFAAPILHHAEPKGFVTLRQPLAGEPWELGDPRSYVYGIDGLGTPYTDRDVLVKWIRRLMVDHDPDIVGREPDLALGLLIEEAVLDFFTNARKRLKTVSAPAPVPA